VNSLTLYAFVKSLGAPCCVVVLIKGVAINKNDVLLYTPCCVVVLVKGVTINGERRLAGYTEISHKSMFNYGF
jgi:hypothetical protein